MKTNFSAVEPVSVNYLVREIRTAGLRVSAGFPSPAGDDFRPTPPCKGRHEAHRLKRRLLERVASWGRNKMGWLPPTSDGIECAYSG